MARVSTYLNFQRQIRDAFNFYKSVFGGEFGGGGVARFSDMPQQEGLSPMAEEDKELIMHIELPILGGHVLMASDTSESMGYKVNNGNNVYINLEPDTREETTRLFNALCQDGKIVTDLQEMFWGGYYGSCVDKYVVQWMFNCTQK